MSRTALLRGATRVLQRVTTRPTVSSSQCLQSHTLLSPCCARCASTGAGADTHPFVSQLVDDQDNRAKAAEVRACTHLPAHMYTAYPGIGTQTQPTPDPLYALPYTLVRTAAHRLRIAFRN